MQLFIIYFVWEGSIFNWAPLTVHLEFFLEKSSTLCSLYTVYRLMVFLYIAIASIRSQIWPIFYIVLNQQPSRLWSQIDSALVRCEVSVHVRLGYVIPTLRAQWKLFCISAPRIIQILLKKILGETGAMRFYLDTKYIKKAKNNQHGCRFSSWVSMKEIPGFRKSKTGSDIRIC